MVETRGTGVTAFHPGDPVLISCISVCSKSECYRRRMCFHCTTGGRILGNEIDGTQSDYVRIPHADTSLYRISAGADEEALVMLGDIPPTGPAAFLTAQFDSAAEIIMIDLDENRPYVSTRFGATETIKAVEEKASETLMKMTGGRSVDTAIDAVGVPAFSITCEDIVAPGGAIQTRSHPGHLRHIRAGGDPPDAQGHHRRVSAWQATSERAIERSSHQVTVTHESSRPHNLEG